MHNQQHPVGSTEKKISVTQLLLAPLNLQINEYAPESWGGSPEPRRAPSPGCLCSQQDPVRPTRASVAGQGSRPTNLSYIGLYSLPHDPMIHWMLPSYPMFPGWPRSGRLLKRSPLCRGQVKCSVWKKIVLRLSASTPCRIINLRTWHTVCYIIQEEVVYDASQHTGDIGRTCGFVFGQ